MGSILKMEEILVMWVSVNLIVYVFLLKTGPLSSSLVGSMRMGILVAVITKSQFY